MTSSLQLTPLGHLIPPPSVSTSLDQNTQNHLTSFKTSTSNGLFSLATSTSPIPTDSALTYWRNFATLFLRALCRLASADNLLLQLAPPPNNELSHLITQAPPFKGNEYLSENTLATLWKNLCLWTQDAIATSQLPLPDWLQKNAPQWHQVGRVCFHLAENKNDPKYPFAFLATYAAQINESGQPQYQPLANALKQYAKADDKAALAALLAPIHHASKQLPFVSNLVESGDIYHPIAWTPEEAHTFLQSIPDLHDNGLLTRIPNWWQSRKKANVNVSVSEADAPQKSLVGLNALLSFNVDVAIGDSPLTRSEIDALLKSNEGLVRLNGQWVEVDPAKLQQALNHWQLVQAQAAQGRITFAQGMRLLAGAYYILDDAPEEADAQHIRDWSNVQTQDALAQTLAQLRDPKNIPQSQQPKNLKGTLRPYQQDGFNWLNLLTSLGLGACLADDMGLGKTIQIIALLTQSSSSSSSSEARIRRHVRHSCSEGGQTQNPSTQTQNPNKFHTSQFTLHTSLLILPASLLANWKAEFQKFAPTLNLTFAHPSETDKPTLSTLAENPPKSLAQTDLVLTTYGMLLRNDWIADTKWNLVILDEAQAIKNPDTRQTQAAKKLKAHSRIALTGTPIENKLTDLWSIFDFINPGLLGTLPQFEAYTNSLRQGENSGYAPLKKLVSPFILRRLKTDKSVISDLPEKTEVNAYCTLAPKQAALYRKAVRELAADLKETEAMERKGLILSALMRFKQICNHPSQSLGDNEYNPADSGKFDRLHELCQEIAERQEKVLIFTQFREMTAPIATHLEKTFGRPGLILHGGTPVAQRQQLVETFQREDGPPFFVLSLKAGGSGLTLTAASHVIHFDRWWNPAVENQATDRAFRIGQKKNVLVHKFISRGTIEEKVDTLITSKRALSDSLLQNNSTPNFTELTNQELLTLINLDLPSSKP